MGVATICEMKPNISAKRPFRPTPTAARHNATDWPISDVTSDLTIEIGTSTFALHKFPLVSRSGKIRKLLLELKDSKTPPKLNLSNIPGGSQAFEVAAKFCYGVNIDFTIPKIAMLRCAARFLEMTEEFSDKNLESRTELYLRDTILPSIPNSVTVLHHCETLLPIAEETNLVSRIIVAIANNACKEQLTTGLSKLEHNYCSKLPVQTPEIISSSSDHWWGKSLTLLNLDFFQRVVSALKTKGLNQDIISKILINYASNQSDLDSEKKQRRKIETIVSLLPTQSRKSSVPMAFLSSLLRSSISASISISVSCRSDLERRIGLQLDQAILEDILIPVSSTGNNNNNHSPLYDTDSVMRIFSIFLNLDEDDEEDDNRLRDHDEYDFDSPESPKQSSIIKVSKLLDNYLAEVALDSNLTPLKFISLAELLPDHARMVYDGLYRAIDIFLKVHPNIKDSERYRLCKIIDSQKLSEEACSHAAQNERLPVQTAVQVLYFEQIRLRNAMNGIGGQNQYLFGIGSQIPHRSGSCVGSGCVSPRDNYASVRRENRELKLEVSRMRMRLTDLEKDHVTIKQELVKPHPANKLFKSFTKKLRRINSLFRVRDFKSVGGDKANSENRFIFHKKRNFSIS